ncbi:MAG: hypothetical protein F4107_10890 [Gemmatimonadetes bacterium]|nr:hypothetical protein [Gemmatimonadota bacterium]MYD15182.1 hypothetical protein [Gemmatimonadota bacterium]MYI66417.1 hypothetical protein [Gemmatimonadota bacterium]
MRYNPLTASDGIMAAVRAHDDDEATESAADEDADTGKPGRWVCSECGSSNLTFSGTGTWNVETQRMEFEEDCEKPFCQRCECRGWAKFVPLREKRGEPNLSRDYYGELYIVIDDDGEPVTPYRLTFKRAAEDREDHGGEALRYRIVKVAYKALPRDDGEPDEIVDDPAGEEAS